MSSSPRPYDAIVFDLDGTLLNRSSALHPHNVEAVRAAEEKGVRVMVATGRSRIATRPVLDAANDASAMLLARESVPPRSTMHPKAEGAEIEAKAGDGSDP